MPDSAILTDAPHKITDQTLIDAAVALRPQLIAEQAEVEKRTYFSEEMHQKFIDAGFYQMLVPKKYGGLEVRLPVFLNVAKEIARGCVSTAWCMTLSANHALQVGSWFPGETQDRIFRDGDFRAPSMYAPTVTATPVEGGYLFNGTVNYCSGIPYSTYFLGQAKLADTNDDGSPRLAVYLAPRSAFTQLDDWGTTLGLKGSGSHSIQFEDGFVPSDLLIEDTVIDDFPIPFGTTHHNNPMYAGRTICLFTMSLAAICIGGGLNALDEYADQMRWRKTGLPPFSTRDEDPDHLRWYGAAYTRLSMAEAALDNIAEQHMKLCEGHANGTREYTIADDLRLAGIARELMIDVWETVDLNLFRTIGSGSARNGERFERVFRDLAQATGHRNPQLRDFSYRTIADLQLKAAKGH